MKKQFERGKLRFALSLVFVSCLAFALSSCEGDEGAMGPAGPTGDTGATGATGPKGADGVDGTDGTDGTDGADGADGADGVDGVDGVDGADGADGADGQNFSNYVQYFNAGFMFEAPISTTSTHPDTTDWFATNALHFGTSAGLADNGKVQSGAIGDSEFSTLNIDVNMPHSGIVQFEVSIDSELDADYLNWYLDGTLVNGISGTGGAFIFYFSVPEGAHTLSFKYVKNASGSTGADAARIDNIVITNYVADGRAALRQPVLPSTVSLRK